LGHLVLLGPANSVHLQRWAEALAGRWRQVTLLTQHPPPPTGAQAWRPPSGIHLEVLPHVGGIGYVRNVPALRARLRALQPDLLHVHYASGYGTLARLARRAMALRRVPTLLSVWGSDVQAFADRSRWHAAWLRGNLRSADALAATSAALAQQVRAVWPEAPDIPLTPFGVDTLRFAPPSVAPTAAPAPLVIGTVKALAHVYGTDLLLEAFAKLVGPHRPGASLLPEVRLRLVGDGDMTDALRRKAEAMAISSLVDFMPAVPHGRVPDEMHRLDIYVAYSRAESFGVAVAEAMACGVPVVVSDVGGLPEVVGDAGCIVPGGRPDRLAEALMSLMLDISRRRALARAGRQRAVACWSWDTCLDRMVEAQAAVLARFGGPASTTDRGGSP